jgi:predicted transposase YbfD/YdcC
LRSPEQAADGKVKKVVAEKVDFHESHYYLSSKDWSAHQFAEAVRGHWLIENRLHWVKDVTLNEDNCIHLPVKIGSQGLP